MRRCTGSHSGWTLCSRGRNGGCGGWPLSASTAETIITSRTAQRCSDVGRERETECSFTVLFAFSLRILHLFSLPPYPSFSLSLSLFLFFSLSLSLPPSPSLSLFSSLSLSLPLSLPPSLPLTLSLFPLSLCLANSLRTPPVSMLRD